MKPVSLKMKPSHVVAVENEMKQQRAMLRSAGLLERQQQIKEDKSRAKSAAVKQRRSKVNQEVSYLLQLHTKSETRFECLQPDIFLTSVKIQLWEICTMKVACLPTHRLIFRQVELLLIIELFHII